MKREKQVQAQLEKDSWSLWLQELLKKVPSQITTSHTKDENSESSSLELREMRALWVKGHQTFPEQEDLILS